MRKTLATLAVAGMTVVALAGCKGYQSADDGVSAQNENVQVAPAAGQATPATPSAATPSAATPSEVRSGNGTTVSVVNNAELGNIVVDAEGFTLYRFDEDTANPSRSNCDGDCAKKWPPAVSPTNWKEVTVAGIDRKLVKSIERADGTCQLTIAGWPVYRFAPDVKPGDIKGQGVGGTWFAVTPEGKKAASNGSGANVVPSKPVPSNTEPSNRTPASPNNEYSSGY